MDESDLRAAQLVGRFTAFAVLHSLRPNENEKLLLKKFKGLVTNLRWSSEDVSRLFEALMERFESSVQDRSGLVSWMVEIIHCIEINYVTSSWRKAGTGRTVTELLRDKTLTDDDFRECLSREAEKTLDEILEEIRREKLNQVDEELLAAVRDVVSSVNEKEAVPSDGSVRSELKRTLRELCSAVERTAKFRPRLTQMVSWCLLALSKTGRLIQVGTGEGKSCVVAMFAAFRAKKREKVDVMSSSSVLAERDLNEWRDFYRVLRLKVDCNTNQLGGGSKECYTCDVVYGTVEQFAGDWLQQHFNRTDIFGQRKFECAIVDEVDSLMLDKGHHTVYLASDMPVYQHLNPLLAFIWSTVNQYSKIGANRTIGPKRPFLEVVLENIKEADELTVLQLAEDSGLLGKGSVKNLRRNRNLLTERTAGLPVHRLADFFKALQRKFPSCRFALYRRNSNGELEELDNATLRGDEEGRRVPLLLVDGGFCRYVYSDEESLLDAAEAQIKRVLRFTPCDLSRSDGSCYVPGFFSDLVKCKLKVWIANAFYAQTMTRDHEYIIEEHGVVPVDFSCTGVVENFRQWTDGLHQFLQMKHQTKLDDMTAITNFMSHVGLLQKYGNQIYGLSGTLGRQAETETLQKIYEGIQTCQIPTYKRRKLFEVEGLVVKDEREWIQKVREVVSEQTSPTNYRGPRAALVICETIEKAKAVHRSLGGKIPNKRLYINNNMDNREISAKTLEAGEVIIATNLAGRGTDLKVSDEVKAAGGLFVLQTFLPKNARVEAQAFGRTARQGSPGSAQLIVCSKHLPETLQLLILLKRLRSVFENILNVTPLHQKMFVMELRLYQIHPSDERARAMSLALSHLMSDKPESEIQTAKDVRDESVAEELSSYLKTVIPKLKKKQELFSLYLEILDKVYETAIDNKPAASDLSALNEFWSLWLLTSFNENDSITDLKIRLLLDVTTARLKLIRKESPSSNLHHYTAFGNDLREKGNLTESIRMYTKAIEADGCWAGVAFYNRAFASLIQKNSRQDPDCIERALEDLQNALKSVELYLEQLDVTRRCSKPQTEEPCRDSRMHQHLATRRAVWRLFKENIEEAIRKVDRARDLGGNVKVEEKLVYFLVPFVYFLPLASRLMESANEIRRSDLLRIHQLVSHPNFDVFNELRCLESLGLTNVYTLDTLFSLGGFFSKIGRKVRRALD